MLGLLTGRPVRDSSQDWIIHRRAAEVLAQDLNIQAECRKIWNDLSDAEQAVLLAVCRTTDGVDFPNIESVTAKHLVVGAGTERRIFARCFGEFVQRQHRQPPAQQSGHPPRSRQR